MQREGWANVWHVNAPAETVQLPQPADAVLFNYTHDILRTPQAVANIMRQAAPGARVAVAGMKFFPWWTGPLNLLPWLKNRPYNARPADLWHPWDLLESHCRDFERTQRDDGHGLSRRGHQALSPTDGTMIARLVLLFLPVPVAASRRCADLRLPQRRPLAHDERRRPTSD